MPVVDELMGAFRAMLSEATDVLMRGRGLRGASRERTRAAVGHALAFSTWQDLTGTQGLDDRRAAELASPTGLRRRLSLEAAPAGEFQRLW